MTRTEVNRVAGTLFANHESGGATFELNARTSVGTTYQMRGVVDWTTSSGRSSVVVDRGPDVAVEEVAWGIDVVVEHVPTLTSSPEWPAAESVDWVLRPPDPDRREVDRLVRVVAGLASDRRENPELILQQSGTAFIREDLIDGVEVDVIRIGERTRYWIDRAGVLRRFEGNDESGTSPIVVDLGAFGPQVVVSPPLERVIDLNEVRSVYAEIVAS